MDQYILKSRSLLFILILLLPFFLGSSNTVIDEQDNFYLSNYTTFAPGSEVTINLYLNGKGREKFKFRLLKIDDPVSFFREADRASIKYRFDIWSSTKGNLLNYTSLVKKWDESVSSSNNYGYSKNVNVGKINEPGIYIVQAIRNDYVAYCAAVVTDYTMIYKSTGDRVLAVLSNAVTGEFLNDVKFDLYKDDKLADSKISSKDGIVLLKSLVQTNNNEINNKPSLIIAETGDEIVVNDPYLYFYGRDNELISYVYTNQPVYRPGQEVFFKSIFRRREGNDLQNAQGEKFTISIKSPRNKEVYTADLTTNEYGTIAGSFILDEEADLGNYSININREFYQYSGSFSVEEYKKPEFQVKVTTAKSNYSRGDLIEGSVSADYYFGSPVNEGSVQLFVYRKNYWRPWWYWSPYSWFYRGYGMEKIPYYGEQQMIHEETGKLDKDGKFSFSYKSNEDADFDYVYSIRAEVIDNSRRAISGVSDVYITRGSFSIFTSPDKYFVQSGKTVNLRVNASDFADKPVGTDFTITINFPDNDPYKDRPPHNITLYGRTDEHGKASIGFNTPTDVTGHFNYVVSAKDDKGREITASGSFFAGNTDDYYHSWGGGFEIVTDKDAYEKGDSLIAFVFLPHSGTDLLLSYESNDIIEYRKVHASGNSITINEKLDKKFAPGFNISVSFVKERQFFTTSKMIGVLDKDRLLNIAINPSKDIYKPGEEAVYTVSVKDNKGNPAANTELSFGLVDESIYAIRADETQPIHNFFFAPAYYYIPTYNSMQMNYYNGSSRKATLVDKDLIKDSESKRGDAKLFGKINYKTNNLPAGNIALLLSGDNGFYKSISDTSGNYMFENIKRGYYEIYLTGQQGLVYIKGIEVKKETEYNFEIDQWIGTEEREMQGGVADGMANRVSEMSLAPNVMQKMKSEDKSGYVQAEVRSDFKDAAFWTASIVTDSKGSAEVKIKLPDNLTTWRATVKGITKNTEAGEERNTVISRKDLLVRMETPRFFRQGDELTITTLVHNYLNEKKTARISFKAENIEVTSSSINSPGYSRNLKTSDGSYEISVDKNSEVRIDWKVKANDPSGNAKLFAEALTDEESDAMKLEIPILPRGFKESDYTVLNISDQFKEESFTFTIPEDVDLRTARYLFTSSPSMSGTMLKAVDELAGYPYGCVEQTMSRFLPTIIAANTFKEMNIPVKASILDELPKMVDAGLKRLYGFQHEDGGWGWWTNDNTNPYMTAYVIYGMSLARKAGYPLNDEIFLKGVENLKNQVRNGDSENPTTLAFMLYALSTSYELQRFNYDQYAGKIEDLLESKVNPYSLSLLGLAAENWHSPLKGKIADKLISLAVQKENLAYWTGENWHYNWQEDKVQSTAFAVKALLKLKGNSDLLDKAVRWLLIQKQGFSWHSTQETAAVIFALSDYLKITGELDPDFNVNIYVNGKEAGTTDFSYADILKDPKEFTITGEALRHGKNEVKIIKEGKGKLYFSGISEYYTMNETSAAKYNSFRIRREYYPLKMEQRGDRMLYVKEKFNGTVKSGQEILVKTFVESSDEGLQYFILEDMLPSGVEPVKDEQNFEIEGENNYKYYDPYMDFRPWIWHYADKEYRDEKVAFFMTQTAGTMEFSYIIKAQIPGEYTASPAIGYLMYYPEVAGHSGMTGITITE